MSAPDADLLQTDVTYLNAMERANRAFLLSLRGHKVPAKDYRWAGMNTTTWTPKEDTPVMRACAARVAEHVAEKARVDALRVERDPCVRCGVRGDVGCQHRRVA